MDKIVVIIYATWSILGIWLVSAIIHYLKRLSEFKPAGQVRLKHSFLIAGAVDALLCMWLTFISNPKDDGWAIFGGFALASTLGILMIIAFVNCRIMYDMSTVRRSNFFGIPSCHQLQEIAIHFQGHEFILILDGKLFKYDRAYIGGEAFSQFAEPHIKKPQNHRILDLGFRAQKAKWTDGAWVGVTALTIGFLGAGLITWYSHMPDMDYSVNFPVYVVTKSDDQVLLYSEESNNPYVIYYSELLPEGLPLGALAKSGDRVIAYAEYKSGYYNPKTGDNPLFSLKINNQTIISFTNYKTHAMQEKRRYILYLAIGYVCVICVFVVTLKISRRDIY